MRTLPSHFQEHRRDGSEFVYLIDVFPRGSDGWGRYRWGEKEVDVDGNTYAGGYIRKVSPIRSRVRIREGGAVATRETVTITLNNKGRLDREMQLNELAGRDVRIALALYPLNLIHNGGFESPTSGDDFDFWVETPGHVSNAITRQTSIKKSGAQSCLISCVTASPAPYITASAAPIRPGTTVSLSFFARAVTAADVLQVVVQLGAFYWNNSTRLWTGTPTVTSFSPSSTAFERFAIDGIFDQAITIPESTTEDVVVTFIVPNAGDGIYLDDVQLEPRLVSGTYHGSRLSMSATELHEIYWGELEEPEWDRTTVTLKTKSIMNRRHRDIPVEIISPATVDPDYIIPPDTLGKPFPITYGDFLFDHVPAGMLFPDKTAAAGLLVNAVAQDNPVRVYFERPGEALTKDTLYHFAVGATSFVRELLDSSDASEWTPGSSDSYFESKSTAYYLKNGLMPLSLRIFGMTVDESQGNWADWTTPEDAVDSDLGTSASVNSIDSAGGKTLYLFLQKPQEFSGRELIAAYVMGKFTITRNAGTYSSQAWGLYMDPADSTAIGATFLTGQGTFNNMPGGADAETDHAFTLDDATRLSDVWLSPESSYNLNFSQVGSSLNSDYDAFMVGVRLDLTIDLLDAVICASTLGRNWPVSKPAGIIKDLLTSELGIAAGDIRTAAFTSVESARNLQCAGQVTEIQASTKVIEQICAAYLIVYYVDGDGLETVAALDYGAPARAIWPHDLEDKPGPKFSSTPRDEIVSDYILHYGYVPFADVYTRSVQCNRSYQNIGSAAYKTKCADAYEALGQVDNFREFWSRWINDDATAIAVLKMLIDWNRGRRRTAKISGAADFLALEFGDRIDLKLEAFLAEANTDASRPVFIPEQISIDHARVEMDLLEVLEP